MREYFFTLVLLNLEISSLENSVDLDQLTKPSDQNPHSFQVCLKIHAYNWNEGRKLHKNFGGV